MRARGWLALVMLGVTGVGCQSSSTGGILSQPDSVKLLDIQAQVFTPRCALSGCHVGAGSPFGLDLAAGVSASNLIGVASAEVPGLLRVEPGDAVDSYLYMKLVGDSRILGDRMPLSGDPLNAGDLGLIRSWIDEGAN